MYSFDTCVKKTLDLSLIPFSQNLGEANLYRVRLFILIIEIFYLINYLFRDFVFIRFGKEEVDY